MAEDKLNPGSSKLDFLTNEKKKPEMVKGRYKILIADDEAEVHSVTKLLLKNFVFEDRGLEFLDTFSAKETKEVLAEHDDIAVLFLDVVMENNQAGLEVVEYIRNELKNQMTRIILRTGQPGEAPEQEIIQKYDINDYRIKTDLTVRRLFTSLYSAMRSYRDLLKLKRHQIGLEKIIKASSSLFTNNSLEEFLTAILEELGSFQSKENDTLYVRSGKGDSSGGVVTKLESDRTTVIAATGKFIPYIGQEIARIPELKHLNSYLQNCTAEGNPNLVRKIEDGFVICGGKNSLTANSVYINGDLDSFDFDLINLFLSNFSIALDNFMLNNLLNAAQKDFIFALAGTLETHYEDAGRHNERVAGMMYQFALINNFSYREARMIKLASILHDLGNVAVPNVILSKPAKLTADEYELIKGHTKSGSDIMGNATFPVLRIAAEIARYHHERFDGSGYPDGIDGLNIPLSSRMMAIVDVFDVVTHKRYYGEAISREEAVKTLLDGRGSQFDPALVDLFVSRLDTILEDKEASSVE